MGHLVFSGSADRTVRIWRRVGGGGGGGWWCLGVLEGHNGPIKCLSGGSDGCSRIDDCEGSMYVFIHLDCDIRVWKIFVPPLPHERTLLSSLFFLLGLNDFY